jgi:hypothetical protein
MPAVNTTVNTAAPGEMDELERKMAELRAEQAIAAALNTGAPGGPTLETKAAAPVVDTRFKSIDCKFLEGHKKWVFTYLADTAASIRPVIPGAPVKKFTMDPHSKDQLTFVMWRLFEIARTVSDKADFDSTEDAVNKILSTLGTTSDDYKMFRYLNGIYKSTGYDSEMSDEEEHLLNVIPSDIDDTELSQLVVELYISFLKRFSFMWAAYSWDAPKKATLKITNGFIRSMDTASSNPSLFCTIYDYGAYCKDQRDAARAVKK